MKNNLVLYVVAAVAGLLAIAGVLNLYRQGEENRQLAVAYAANLQERNEDYSRLLQFTTQEVAEKTAALSRVENLENQLTAETANKEAALNGLKNLNWQLKDTTAKSVEVETALNEKINNLSAETKALQARFSEKSYQLELTENRLKQETEDKEWFSKGYYSVRESLDDWYYDNKALKNEIKSKEGQLGVARELIKGVLIDAGGHNIGTGKIVKSVIFVPSDIKLPTTEIDRYRTATRKALKFDQLWLFGQLGETFSPAEPAIFLGKKKLVEYDKLSPGQRMMEIRREVNASYAETFVMFLVGSNDRASWGTSSPPTALISQATTDLILNGDDIGAAIVAHELGHVWGLPHLVANDKNAIMMVRSDGFAPATNSFPFAMFTEQEKDILRSNLAKK